jgi:hypothetical protein
VSYQPPHLRARRGADVVTATAVAPLAAPALLAAMREVICKMQCGCAGAAICPLHGCCPKPISETVQLATRSCPAGYWKAWLPTK